MKAFKTCGVKFITFTDIVTFVVTRLPNTRKGINYPNIHFKFTSITVDKIIAVNNIENVSVFHSVRQQSVILHCVDLHAEMYLVLVNPTLPSEQYNITSESNLDF